MGSYPNYRVSVEVVLKKKGRVLLARRAETCDVAPGVWNVPAGKVKYEEIPAVAAVRECAEELGIEARVVREIGCRTLKTSVKGEEAFRLIFTYLMEPRDEAHAEVLLNEEHTECIWLASEELHAPAYETLHPDLREIILRGAF